MILPILAGLWGAGALFFIGMAVGDNQGAESILLSLVWPLALPYVLVWGTHRRRRWFCRLTNHKWRETVNGVQCKRCWLVEYLPLSQLPVEQGGTSLRKGTDGSHAEHRS